LDVIETRLVHKLAEAKEAQKKAGATFAAAKVASGIAKKKAHRSQEGFERS
jgi:hypothetical protein